MAWIGVIRDGRLPVVGQAAPSDTSSARLARSTTSLRGAIRTKRCDTVGQLSRSTSARVDAV